jgi:hypothetical protein
LDNSKAQWVGCFRHKAALESLDCAGNERFLAAISGTSRMTGFQKLNGACGVANRNG